MDAIMDVEPTIDGFMQYVFRQHPALVGENNYLADRIAIHMFHRYIKLRNTNSRNSRNVHNSITDRAEEQSIIGSFGGDDPYFGHNPDVCQDAIVSGISQEPRLEPDGFPLGFPMPPPVAQYSTEFKCQFCARNCMISKPSDWTEHVLEDSQPYSCVRERCYSSELLYKKKADWVHHDNEVHSQSKSYMCNIHPCDYKCVEQDKFLSHLVNKHKFADPRAKGQEVSVALFDRMWRMERQCHVTTSRQSQDEPCKFCGRKFHTLKKLTDHLANHMAAISIPILRLVEKANRSPMKPAGYTASVPLYPDFRLATYNRDYVLRPNLPALRFDIQSEASVSKIVTPPAPTNSGYTSMGKVISGVMSSEHNDQTSQFDDSATEYTDAPSVASSQRESFLSNFADDLFDKIQEMQPDEKDIARISTLLPDLLKVFALRLGYNAPAKPHSEVVYFVHKYRTKKKLHDESLGNGTHRVTANDEKMSLDELMNSWFRGQDNGLESPPMFRSGETISDSKPTYLDEQEYDNERALAMGYRNVVLESEAFRWLLVRLHTELRLASTNPGAMESIRREILASLRSTNIVNVFSRKIGLEEFEATFLIKWNLLTYLEQQDYACGPSQAFAKVISLTGSIQDAQALTCSEYMKQTWPLTGDVTIRLIQDSLRQGIDGTPQSGKFGPDSILVLEARGNPFSLAEIGEQLAWLATVFRLSSFKSGPVCCTPSIDSIYQVPHRLRGTPVKNAIECTFGFDQSQHSMPNTRGQCWHDLFLNPIVVTGYPIPSRKEPGTGLEIPLHMMAGLARTGQVNIFNGKTFIKGYSTLLIPTKRNGNTLIWHLVYKRNGSRISYLAGAAIPAQDIGNLDLATLRHVLGWCSEAAVYAGSARANNLIGGSGLPKPDQGAALAGLFVSPGKAIMGGAAFVLGVKETPPHVGRKSYIEKLRWIDAQRVLLWDESDKRGWLINGSTALLYIVRASLAHNSMDKFKSAFVFRPEHVSESEEPLVPDSALHVLLNRKNWALKLYHEDDGDFPLKRRVNQVYGILEKLIDHQSDITGENGIKMIGQPRNCLEGWDFRDLLTFRDPLYPRVTTVDSKGKGWIDMTRALHTVTLFGRGFGELIKPIGLDCGHWSSLPKQEYYVAASFSDLAEVVNKNDFYDDGHARVSETMIWHTPTAMFASCQCQGTLRRDHCEPVQTLLPSDMLNASLSRKITIPQISSGAVIFGHHSGFPWVWGDFGYPTEGDPPLSPRTSEVESFQDSGIGLGGRTLQQEKTWSSRSSAPNVEQSASSCDIDVSQSDRTTPAMDQIHSSGEYTVGIICALPKELLAVRALFDKKHADLKIKEDVNRYVLGEIGKHMVVAACLPKGDYGTNPAADSASNMRRSFGKIRFCLLVGIGGGVPSKEHDIHLGDVVVSIPTGEYPGVIQYDRGKENENSKFEPSGSLPPPPRFLSTAISYLESDPDRPSNPLQPYLTQIEQRISSSDKLKYKHPGVEHDTFSQNECLKCSQQSSCAGRNKYLAERPCRTTEDPKIFYGLIASGNRVIKDGHFRNELAQKCDVLCFEMEAAGILNIFPCLVIRGICDYADSSKNKLWQEYASATAAAYAKLLLSEVAQAQAQTEGQYELSGVSSQGQGKRRDTLNLRDDEEANPKRRRL
ncbi:hypothetical protein F4808DRAFT_453229 [Astrocystis sublimbata]|nr:hypothetical protein F4808DRAFT_453229 [Astrocystis sublimbata]